EWYRLVWYAAAPKKTVDNLSGGVPVGWVNPSPPPPAPGCLGINGTPNIRALMGLFGRSLRNPANPPNGDPLGYPGHANCDRTLVGGVFKCVPGATFEQRSMRTDKIVLSPSFAPPNNAPFYAPFNDRIVLVDWIAPTPTFPVSTLLP